MNSGTVKKEKRDETLLRIIMLAESCISRLRESQFPYANGIHAVGDFEVELSRSRGSHEDAEIDFWTKGKKDEQSTRLTGSRRSFILFMKEKRIVFEDYAGLKIVEYLKKKSAYPHFQVEWTGIENKDVAKGTLVFFRIDFSGSDFVNYYYNVKNGSYDIYNPRKLNFSTLGIPKDLTKVTDVLGCPIKMRIDFDARKKEILATSGLEELSLEIFSLTK